MNRNKILASLLLAACIWVSECIASEGYEILFRGVTSKLTLEEQLQIFQQLEFRVSDNGKFHTDYCDRDVSPVVEVVDLNRDGVDEVFVYWGNICTSGNAERSISLFIKDAFGRYVMNLGFPAVSYRILATKNQGFPDLEFGGPGFCRGVWQWNGYKYEYKCSREEEPGGCTRKGVKTLCEWTRQGQTAQPAGTTSPEGTPEPDVRTQMPVKILKGTVDASSPKDLRIRVTGEESSTWISVRVGQKTKFIPLRRPAVDETVEVEYRDENGGKFGYVVRVVDVSPGTTSPAGTPKTDVQSQMPFKTLKGTVVDAFPGPLRIRVTGEESSTTISVSVGKKTTFIPFRRPATDETVEVVYQDQDGDKFGYVVRVVDVSPGTTSPAGTPKPDVQSQMPVKILKGTVVASAPKSLQIQVTGEESSTPISIRVGLKTKFIPFRRPAVGETVEVEYQDENGDKFGYGVRVIGW